MSMSWEDRDTQEVSLQLMEMIWEIFILVS